MRRFQLLPLVAVMALVASAGFAVKPSHAAVTLGSDLEPAPDTFLGCGEDCLQIQDVLPGRQLVSPFDGVIVRWRARVGAGTDAQSIRIRVVRRFDADQFTLITSSPSEPIPAGAGSYTFPAQLPIRSGDQLGGDATAQSEIVWGAEVGGAHFLTYIPNPLDGGITSEPGPGGDDTELLINADVEADLDHDNFGDETQDQCPTNASTQGPCPVAQPATTAKKKCKKKKKHKRSAESAKKKKCKKKKKK